MIRKIGYSLLALLILGTVAISISYSSFSGQRLTAIETGSQMADTAVGPMEFQQIGDSGPVVLLLHGTPGGYDQAQLVEGTLVLAPSRPGYLRTPLETGRTPEEQADAYVALMDTLGIDKVIVMGASGGGPSAIAFAARHPDRTVALIAYAAASQATAYQDGPSERPFFMHSDFYMWAIFSAMNNIMGPEGLVELAVPNPKNQRLILDDPANLEGIVAMMWSIWPPSQRQAGMANDYIQFAALDLGVNAITAPTLIIIGTEDSMYAQSITLSEQIPGAILHTIEGAGHMMIFSHSEEIAAAIEAFLSGLRTEQGGYL